MQLVSPEDTPISRIRRWQNGEKPGPWKLVVYPTDRCNLNCIMCWRHAFPTEPKKEVSDERLLRIIDEAAELDVYEVDFVGGGEPAMRPKLLMDLCRKTRQHGMLGYIQNNGTLYKPEQIDELVEMQWTVITISLDAPDAELNDQIRGKAVFERATRALRGFAEAKRRHNACLPDMQVYMTLSKLNYARLPGMVDLVHEVGAASLWAGYAMGDWCKDLHLTPDDFKRMPRILEQTLKRGKELGVYVNMDALNPKWETPVRDAVWRTLFGAPQGFVGALCFEPWHTLEVRADGRIGPCCMAYDEKAPTVHDSSLRDLWYGPYFTHVRERIAAHKPMPFCKLCQVFMKQQAEIQRRELARQDVFENRESLGFLGRSACTCWDGLRGIRERLGH